MNTENTIECQICIDEIPSNQIFNCNACKFTNCITCHKKYLLSNSQYPHCINPDCRSKIPYDIFLKKFDKKWIFNEYKDHRSNILLNKEKSLLPETVKQIAIEKDIEEKRKKYYNEIYELKKKLYKIENNIYNLSNNKTEKKKFNYIYACPLPNCKGFLDDEFNCALCDSIVCNKCYIVKDNKKNKSKNTHECNPELIETFNMIKKEAKPCPTCGEFISKISGCDQMFCVKCGTAFSWTTGIVEKSIIHNPHAHEYFQKNPEARDAYLNALNGAGNDNQCRENIPNFHHFQNINVIGNDFSNYILVTHRNISEFRQYNRERILRALNNNNNTDQNELIRRKYINNIYSDKMFKTLLHKKEKHNFFIKELYPLILFAYEIAESILWNIVDIAKQNYVITNGKVIGIKKEGIDNISKCIDMLKQNATDTQYNMTQLKCDFGYTTSCMLTNTYHSCIPHL